MRRRDRDPRPEIEVVGADRPDLSSSARVEVGGRGTGSARGAVAAVVAVALVIVGGLALGGTDDPDDAGAAVDDTTTTTDPERATSTSRRPRPTTTTTTLPAGPVFGEAVDGHLLVHSMGQWTLVDLGTGDRRRVRLTRDAYSGVAVPGGVVLVGASPEGTGALYYDLTTDDPEARFLGEADRVLPAGDPSQVWLIDGLGFDSPEPPGTVPNVSLVTTEGEVLRRIDVPFGWVLGAGASGAVTDQGGRVFVVDESGPTALGVGQLLAASGDIAVVSTCDEAARCGADVIDVGTGRTSGLTAFADVEYGLELALRPDGWLALLSYGGSRDERSRLAVVDDAGALVATADPSIFSGPPVWLPGDLGLLLADGGPPVRVAIEDGELVEHPVPALGDLPADVVYVIPG